MYIEAVHPLQIIAVEFGASNAVATWQTNPPSASIGRLPAKNEDQLAAFIQCGNITNLTFTLALTIDGVTRNPVMVTDAGTLIASGGTVTTVDGLMVGFLLPSGTTKVELTTGAGSGNVGLVLAPLEVLGAMYDKALGVNGLSLAAGENYVGQVGPKLRHVEVTLSLDTSAYTAGDVHADSQIVSGIAAGNDRKGYIVGLQANDEDDQTAAQLDVYFLSANVSLGTENAAPSISDANARNILPGSPVRLAATDWNDLGGVKVAGKAAGNSPLPMAFVPVSGSSDLYVATVCAGTPTQTASGMRLRIMAQDGA